MSRQWLARRRWNRTAIRLFAPLVLISIAGWTTASRGSDETDQVKLGRELFIRQWQPNDPRSLAGDGLGPRFNEKSCVACHEQGGIGGAGPVSKNVEILALGNKVTDASGPDAEEFLRLLPECISAPAVLHKFSTAKDYQGWRRSLVARPLPPGWELTSTSLVYRLSDPALLKASSVEFDMTGIKRLLMIDGLELRLTERNTPAIFGAGLIETIPLWAMKEAEASQPKSVRGRLAWLTNGQVGRFGWKAQNATLLDFTQNACAVELGLENPGHHQAPLLGTHAEDAQPDLSLEDCQALAAFEAALPAPKQIVPKFPSFLSEVTKGRQLFEQIGCADCHVPNLGGVEGIYSDLLLHDMGAKLAGQVYYSTASLNALRGIQPEAPVAASSTEWRTPPLWGCNDTAPYMHDGRAQTLDEAIRMHENQGLASHNAYCALTAAKRGWLMAFLHTLRTPRSAETVRKSYERGPSHSPAEPTPTDRVHQPLILGVKRAGAE